jgi:glycosyltransferase involved in cell wall biosynthesis
VQPDAFGVDHYSCVQLRRIYRRGGELGTASIAYNIEVIVVDDGSTDNTAEIAQRLMQQDARVRYVYQANQGLSAARNTGIKNAKGEFLVFLDADDVLHEHKVAAHLEHFEARTDDRYFLRQQPLFFIRAAGKNLCQYCAG